MNIAVIGVGSWGTAIADLLAKNGHTVKVWDIDESVCDGINQNQRNPKYLSNVSLGKMFASTDFQTVLEDSQVVVNGVPTVYLRSVMTKAKPYFNDQIVVSLTKGIEVDTGLRPSQILREIIGDQCHSIGALSGPNLAREVAKEVPSATVIASENADDAKILQKAFMTPYFRVYTSHDLAGVELGGALKNVIAIAAGICDGIGFGDNTKASLMTRGLVEMKKLSKLMGAQSETLSGLSRMGDLIATCSSRLSRNRTFGEMIGKGMTVAEAEKELGMVAEGVKTSLAVNEIARKLGLELPICHIVEKVLFEGLSPHEAATQLMTRNPKHES